MAAFPKTLLALEKKFWTGDEKFYRETVDNPASSPSPTCPA